MTIDYNLTYEKEWYSLWRLSKIVRCRRPLCGGNRVTVHFVVREKVETSHNDRKRIFNFVTLNFDLSYSLNCEYV